MRTRRAVITRLGGPEVLAIVEDELPDPWAGQVQAAILASEVASGDVKSERICAPGMGYGRFPEAVRRRCE
jgi:NADPH:quinone reductase-like Zn-dependent oxidoreductase